MPANNMADMLDDERTVADNVARLRKAHGLTYRGLSELTGPPELGLRRITKYERRVNISDLVRLATAFGITKEVMLRPVEIAIAVTSTQEEA